MVFNLSESPGLHQVFLGELRNPEIQTDRLGFRKNMERLGQILAYEISKNLPYSVAEIRSPLGIASHRVPAENPVLCCILRAGLPFFNGFLDFFSQSDSGFIGAYRGHSENNHSFEIELDYLALPAVEGKILILIDPMLATGKSMVKAARAIFRHGNPSRLIVASMIASPEGIEYVKSAFPDTEIWTISIDHGLNDHAYIVPGLGDAGDLSYGTKTN